MSEHGDADYYSVTIEWSDEDGVYIVTVPELPGCRTHADTRAAALRKAEELIAEWLELAAELGWDVPTPRTFDGRSPYPPEAATPVPASMAR